MEVSSPDAQSLRGVAEFQPGPVTAQPSSPSFPMLINVSMYFEWTQVNMFFLVFMVTNHTNYVVPFIIMYLCVPVVPLKTSFAYYLSLVSFFQLF